MAKRLSIRKTRYDRRSFRVTASFDIVFDGAVLAKVQESNTAGRWYWYGMQGPSANTAHNPRDFETVKAEAMACCRTYLAGAPAMVGDQGVSK